MKTLEPQTNSKKGQPLKPPAKSQKPSRNYIRRQRMFIALSGVLVAALLLVFLNQFGLISFLRSEITSALTMVNATGIIKDAQTSQPLAHVRVTARIFSFDTQTETDVHGYFSMRVPNSAQIIVTVPNYEPQPMTPGVNLQVQLTPDPGTTAQRYMDAFLHQQFDQLWRMLAPDAQTFWGSQANFSSFLTHKFGPLPRLSFTIGSAKMLPTWINPDTTLSYQNVVVMPITLTLGPSTNTLSPASAQAVANGLFENLPLTEIKDDNLWRVLLGGPLDREAPIVIPAKPPALTIKVPILMYHHIAPHPSQSDIRAGLGGNTVKTPDFATQMDYLAQNGYHPIILTDVFNNLYYGLPLPAHPIVISFDDGYADNFTDALPILQRHHFVAEINVISGLIGGLWLTWDQVRQMAAVGFEIGSHTVHHISLAAALPATAEQELSDSKKTLEQQVGKPIQFFCYPSGEPFHHGSLERRQFIKTLLYQDGYVGALLDPGTTSVVQNAQTPYELYRIRVSGDEQMPLFIKTLQGLGVGPDPGANGD